jgi:crossover junction endodeoxyribonuclease RuvC
MKIVGIDPGLKATGFSFIEQNGNDVQLLEIGTIKPKAQATIAIKLQEIYQTLSQLINVHSPEVLVLEKIYSHVKHPTTIGVLGHVRGVVCLLCAQKDLVLMEYSVKRVRKAITGNGNATKAQTQKIVANLFRIDGSTLSLDASDSLALALGYVYMNKRIL